MKPDRRRHSGEAAEAGNALVSARRSAVAVAVDAGADAVVAAEAEGLDIDTVFTRIQVVSLAETCLSPQEEGRDFWRKDELPRISLPTGGDKKPFLGLIASILQPRIPR